MERRKEGKKEEKVSTGLTDFNQSVCLRTLKIDSHCHRFVVVVI